MYSGNNPGWPLPDGINSCRSYWWIQQICYSCMLELFTFISGYVYAFGCSCNGGGNSLYSLLLKKTKRLIIPALLFGVFYFALFYSKNCFYLDALYDLLNGMGHLWYLVMLFGVFIIDYFLSSICEKKNIKKIFQLVICLFIAIISVLIPNYFQLSKIAYFLFFFYLGKYIFIFRYQIKKYITIENLSLSWTLYVSLFIVLVPVREGISSLVNCGDPRLNSLIVSFIRNLIVLIYSTFGVIAFWALFYKYSRPKHSKLIKWFNRNCFGCYIFHQFFLQFIFYKTQLPHLLGTYLLPFVACVITLILSLLFSGFCTKTKFLKDVI